MQHKVELDALTRAKRFYRQAVEAAMSSDRPAVERELRAAEEDLERAQEQLRHSQDEAALAEATARLRRPGAACPF